MLKNLYNNAINYKFLLKELIKRDFKVKYKRSALGILWSILYPLLMMSVMSIVFSNMFKFKMEGVNYLVYLMCGLIIFNFFSDATNNSLTSVVGNSSLINKVYIPKYIFTLAKCLFSGLNFLFTLIPFFLIIIISGDVALGTKCYLNIGYLLIPFIFLCTLMFTLGICYILSTVTVFLRDVIYIWGILLTILNYFTPIFYSINILPEALQKLFVLNPLYIYINSLRDIILFGNIPSFLTFVLMFIIGFVVMLIGLIVFRNKQDKFIYYI